MNMYLKLSIGAAALINIFLAQASDAKSTVTVTNGPGNAVPVTVQNTVSTRATDNPALQPYEQGGQITFASNANGGTIDFDVPAGKRLVIESVTITANLTTGQRLVNAAFRTTNNSSLLYHDLVIHDEGHDALLDIDVFTASQLTRGYSDAGTGSVRVSCRRDTATGAGSTANVSVTGYLIDLPTTTTAP
jgi:hypothetical protein